MNTITNRESELNSYLIGLGLSIKVEQDFNDNAPDHWLNNANHYRITLKRANRSMRFWFYQGYGIKHDPTLESVIENLAMDNTYSDLTIEDFGDQLGWGKDTKRNYKLLNSLCSRYRRVIGDDDLINSIFERVTQ